MNKIKKKKNKENSCNLLLMIIGFSPRLSNYSKKKQLRYIVEGLLLSFTINAKAASLTSHLSFLTTLWTFCFLGWIWILNDGMTSICRHEWGNMPRSMIKNIRRICSRILNILLKLTHWRRVIAGLSSLIYFINFTSQYVHRICIKRGPQSAQKCTHFTRPRPKFLHSSRVGPALFHATRIRVFTPWVRFFFNVGLIRGLLYTVHLASLDCKPY